MLGYAESSGRPVEQLWRQTNFCSSLRLDSHREGSLVEEQNSPINLPGLPIATKHYMLCDLSFKHIFWCSQSDFWQCPMNTPQTDDHGGGFVLLPPPPNLRKLDSTGPLELPSRVNQQLRVWTPGWGEVFQHFPENNQNMCWREKLLWMTFSLRDWRRNSLPYSYVMACRSLLSFAMRW